MMTLKMSSERLSRWLRLAALVFVATVLSSVGAIAYDISGTVTYCSGQGLGGVTVTAGAYSATTSDNGSYVITGVPGSAKGITYTVKPTLNGFTFTPASTDVTIKTSNKVNINFTAAYNGTIKYSISGVVTCGGAGLGGVTVRATGPGTYTSLPTGSGRLLHHLERPGELHELYGDSLRVRLHLRSGQPECDRSVR